MADQLTSVGVEFDKNEMQRIFFSLQPGAVAHEWSMGDLRSSTSVTSIPDRVYNFLATPVRKLLGIRVTGRTPGLYRTESIVFAGQTDGLYNANELIHPSVRLRYWYNGKGPNGAELWGCPSLIDNDYRLEKRDGPPPPTRPARVEGMEEPYRTVTGVAAPYFGTAADTAATAATATGNGFRAGRADGARRVRTEQPGESELEPVLPPRSHWVWKRVDPSTGEVVVLEEEQVGVWERMFMTINRKVQSWQWDSAAGRGREEEEVEEEKASFFGMIAGGVKGVVAKIGGLFAKEKGVRPFLAPAGEGYDRPGFHDIVVWQKGDLN
jgi:hypothetical protein